MSAVLDAHRKRVAALDEAMSRLQALHEEAYGAWNRIVQLASRNSPERIAELDLLHEQVYGLAERIARLREETFGSISRESQLLLTSTVESARPSVVTPEPAPVPGP